MKKTTAFVLLSALFGGGVVFSQETRIRIRVEDLTEKEEALPVEVKKRKPKTETTVKEEELRKRSGAGSVNVFKAIELTPSLNIQADDPYGLGGGSIILRGFDETQIGVTIDGMPLNDSGNYRLYPHEYADIENLESINIERGAVSKRNPFYVDVGGSVRIRTRPPADRFGLTLRGKYGSFEFKRYFIRLDTGYLLGNKNLPKMFFSYSHTEADKWKGPGKHPEYRDHYTVGISHKVGPLFWEFYYDLNVQLNYFYRGFSFSELNTSAFRGRDYNDRLIPGAPPAQNVLYYEFYQNPYTNQQLRANIELDITRNIKFSLKPYMWIGRGSGTSATRSGPNVFFRESFNYTDRPGVISEVKLELPRDSRLYLGYWYEFSELKQWQPSRRVNIQPNGTFTLDNNSASFRYNYIQKTKTTTNTPYFFFESSGLLDKLDINFGLRYANVERDFDAYDTAGLPYYPRDGVYKDPRLRQDNRLSYEKTYRKVLPSLGFGYQFTNSIYGYFAYAKNFRVPQNFIGDVPGPLTAQFVVDRLEPEEADNFDIGVRFDIDRFYISPSLYYVDYKNRLVRVADPTDPNLVYLQNAGKVRAYGAELEAGVALRKRSSVYISLSFNEAKFKNDFIFDGPNPRFVKNRTVPDTPKIMAKFGGRFDAVGFRISPSVQYIGSRFGNFINTEKVEPYVLIDLNVERRLSRNITAFVDVKNITNTVYVGRISPGIASGTYFAGPPFSIAGGLSGRF
ncbi:TonB-dependent receptor [Thermocrinis sp.]